MKNKIETKVEMPEFEITSLSLIVNCNEMSTSDISILINAISLEMEEFIALDEIGSIVECNDNDEFVTRSRTLYKITEYKNERIHVLSESSKYFYSVCNLLDGMNISYRVTNICFRFNSYKRLQDVVDFNSTYYLSPEAPDEIYKYARTYSTLEFNFNLSVKDLKSAFIDHKLISDSLQNCNIINHLHEILPNKEDYYSRNILRISEYIPIDLFEEILYIIKNELDRALYRLNI